MNCFFDETDNLSSAEGKMGNCPVVWLCSSTIVRESFNQRHILRSETF
jgi:hypothetical protein